MAFTTHFSADGRNLPQPRIPSTYSVTGATGHAGGAVPGSYARQEDGDLEIWGWVRLDDRASLCQQLGQRAAVPDLDLILDGYRTWGEKVVDHLYGDFAFVLRCASTGSVLLARDPVGNLPMYWAQGPDWLSASTHGALLANQPSVGDALDYRWLAGFIASARPQAERTPFEAVRRFPPGHVLSWRGGGTTWRRFHDYSTDSPGDDRLQQHWREDYREALFTAVADRTGCHAGPQGFELTAGLDSSSIAAVAAALDADRLGTSHAMSIAKWARVGERVFTLALELGFGHVDFVVGRPHYRTELASYRTRAVDAVGWPPEHPDAVMYLPLLDLCADLGIKRLHSGYGGDMAVTNPAIGAGAEILRRSGRSAWQRHLGTCRAHPRRLAHEVKLSRLARAQPAGFIVDDTPILTPEARRLVTYDPPMPVATVNETVLRYGLTIEMQLRHEALALTSAALGVQYTYPMLDVRLVQQYLSTPTVWKRHDGHGRYLHRMAVQDILPGDIVWAPKEALSRAHDREAEARRKSVDPMADFLAWGKELAENPHPSLVELLDVPLLESFIASMRHRVWDYEAGSLASVSQAQRLNQWLWRCRPT